MLGHSHIKRNLYIENSVLTFTALAAIACRVTLGHDVDFKDVGYCGLAFARRFAGQWPVRGGRSGVALAVKLVICNSISAFLLLTLQCPACHGNAQPTGCRSSEKRAPLT
jgi:hypothetical protein